MLADGVRLRISRIVSAKIDAPPSLDIISIDGRDDDVREVERGDRIGDARGFGGVIGVRAPMAHRAVAARARADVAKDHERRGAMRPALADVRAARFFADRVEIEVAHQALQPEIRRRPGRFHLEPFGLWGARCYWGEGDDPGHVSAILMDKGISSKIAGYVFGRGTNRWDWFRQRSSPKSTPPLRTPEIVPSLAADQGPSP